MERVPFFRRPTVLLALGALAGAALYLHLQGRVIAPAVPRFMLFTAPPLAFVCLLYLGYRSASILFNGQPESRSLPVSAAWLLGILALLGSNLLLFSTAEEPARLAGAIIDLDLLLLVFLLTLLLCSQFVLPVDSLEDRLAVADRLLGHALGERGPVTYVHNGQAVQAHGEDQRRGPGVFLVDYASAVVLRTDTRFTRAAGPGVTFTQAGERLAEAVDLRRQERSLPPAQAATGQDPARGTSTSLAVTRDGIPVSAQISITFMIDPGHRREPREGRDPEKPPYEFHAASVERAVFGHVYGAYDDVSWKDLPLLLLADVWREEIKRWSLNELLAEPSGAPTPLQRITETLQARLIPAPENVSEAEGDRPADLESGILAARGIRPIDLEVRNLQPPADVQRERLLQWHEAWYGEIQHSLQEAREELDRSRRRGEAEASLQLLQRIPSGLERALEAGEQPGRRETLRVLLQEARGLFSSDGPLPETHPLIQQLERMLQAIEAREDGCLEEQE